MAGTNGSPEAVPNLGKSAPVCYLTSDMPTKLQQPISRCLQTRLGEKKRGSKPASALTGENTKLRCTVMLCAMAEGAKLRQYATFKCKELTSTPLFPGIIVRANNSRINSDASNPGKKTRCLFGLPVDVGAGAWTHCKASQPTR